MKTSLLSFFALLLIACGSSDETENKTTNSESSPTGPSGANGANACESAGTRLCERACACATDGKCRIGAATEGGVASINLEDEQACRDLYVTLGCLGGGEPGFDYVRCESVVETAACVATAGGQGVLMPDECKVSRK